MERKKRRSIRDCEGLSQSFRSCGRRGFAGFEVALNAQSGKEGQYHLRNCGRSHLGLFRFDVHGEKALQ